MTETKQLEVNLFSKKKELIQKFNYAFQNPSLTALEREKLLNSLEKLVADSTK
jgi:hypothetical protein